MEQKQFDKQKLKLLSQAGRKAGRQAGRKTERQEGRQEDRETGRQAGIIKASM